MGNSSGYAGSITIGGVELSEIAPETLYRKITRVSMRATLRLQSWKILRWERRTPDFGDGGGFAEKVELYDTFNGKRRTAIETLRKSVESVGWAETAAGAGTRTAA